MNALVHQSIRLKRTCHSHHGSILTLSELTVVNYSFINSTLSHTMSLSGLPWWGTVAGLAFQKLQQPRSNNPTFSLQFFPPPTPVSIYWTQQTWEMSGILAHESKRNPCFIFGHGFSICTTAGSGNIFLFLIFKLTTWFQVNQNFPDPGHFPISQLLPIRIHLRCLSYHY